MNVDQLLDIARDDMMDELNTMLMSLRRSHLSNHGIAALNAILRPIYQHHLSRRRLS